MKTVNRTRKTLISSKLSTWRMTYSYNCQRSDMAPLTHSMPASIWQRMLTTMVRQFPQSSHGSRTRKGPSKDMMVPLQVKRKTPVPSSPSLKVIRVCRDVETPEPHSRSLASLAQSRMHLPWSYCIRLSCTLRKSRPQVRDLSMVITLSMAFPSMRYCAQIASAYRFSETWWCSISRSIDRLLVVLCSS